MRKFGLILLLCCLPLLAAGAESMPEGVIQYIPKEYPCHITDALPLPDGGIVFAGLMYYPGQFKSAKDIDSTYSMIDRVVNTGYAVCLEPDGEVRWEINIGDKEMYTRLSAKGVLPDGRLLLHRLRLDENFNRLDDYFLVDSEGNFTEAAELTIAIDSALSHDELAVVSAGYLGGDKTMFGFDAVEMPGEMILLSWDLTQEWSITPKTALPRAYLWATEAEDGYVLYGQARSDDFTETSTLVAKLDRQGQPVWAFDERSNGPAGGASGLGILPDGGVVFTGRYSPDGLRLTSYGYPLPTLTRLDAEGNHLWTRVFEESEAAGLEAAASLGQDIVLSVTRVYQEHALLRLDAEGNTLGSVAVHRIGDLYALNAPDLLRAADGSLYAYGSLHAYTRESSLQGGDAYGLYFCKITEETFR